MDLKNLSEDEQQVLAALLTLAPIQARTLSKRLGFPQSTLFRCLTALEDAGLVTTQSDVDPLRRHITLTAAANNLKAAL